MSFLSTLFSNQALADKALGFLRGTMKEQGVKYVVLTLRDDDSFGYDMYKEENKPVIFSQETVNDMAITFETYKSDLANLKKQVELYNSQGGNFEATTTQMLKEQETVIMEQRAALDAYNARFGPINVAATNAAIQEERKAQGRFPAGTSQQLLEQQSLQYGDNKH